MRNAVRLLEQLWESLSATPGAVPLTGAQRQELDRRLDELDRDGPVGIPWEEVLQRIRSRAADACVYGFFREKNPPNRDVFRLASRSVSYPSIFRRYSMLAGAASSNVAPR